MSPAWGPPGRYMDLERVRQYAVEDVLDGEGSIPGIAAKWGVLGADLAEWVAAASPPADQPGDGEPTR